METFPPSLSDWGDHHIGDLDKEYAYSKFAGKTYQQAMDLFETSDLLSRAEDLTNMPAVPFRFYMLIFRDFVLSQKVFDMCHGLDTATAASSFLETVLDRIVTAPELIRPIIHELLPAVRHVAQHQHKYEADEDIYGDFSEILHRIEQLADA